MKNKILTTKQLKENDFDFETVEKQILAENKLLYFKEYPKEKKRKRTLSQFISHFINYLNNEYDTYKVGEDSIQCDILADRSLTDIFLCCKYYYPECTLQEVATLLWNKLGLRSWYCPNIKRRVYTLSKRNKELYINDIELEDELEFLGIVRNGRLLREDDEDDDYYDDDWID